MTGNIQASSTFDAGSTGASVPSNGTDFFTSGSAGGSGTAKYDTTHIHGSSGKSCHFNMTNGTDTIFRNYDFGTPPTVGCFRGYLYFTALPAATITLLAAYRSGTKIGDVRLLSTGVVNVRNVNTSIGSTTALSINTLYRVEWKVSPNPSGGTQELRIYSATNLEADIGTFDQSVSGSAAGTTATAVDQFRIPLTGAAWDLWLDDAAAGDTDFLGPTSKAISAAGQAIASASDAWSVTRSLTASAVATAHGSADTSLVHVGGGTTDASTTFEAGVVGASVPINGTDLFNTGTTVAGSCVYDSIHTHIGSGRSIHFNTTDPTNGPFRTYQYGAAVATAALRGYLTVEALPATTVLLAAMYNGATKIADLRLTAAGLIQIRDVSTQADIATIPVTPGTLYRIEWKVTPNATTGTQALKIASGTNLDLSSGVDEPMLSGNARGSGATTVGEIRLCLTGAAFDVWWDDYAVGHTDFIGPSVSGKVIDATLQLVAAGTASMLRKVILPATVAVITATGTADASVTHGPGFGIDWVVKSAKVWNGSAWVAKPTKVWNGTAWVTKPAKVQGQVVQGGGHGPFPIAGGLVVTAGSLAQATVVSQPPPAGSVIFGSSFQGNSVSGWQGMDLLIRNAAGLSPTTYSEPPFVMKARRSYNSGMTSSIASGNASSDRGNGIISVYSVKTENANPGGMAAGTYSTQTQQLAASCDPNRITYLIWEHEFDNNAGYVPANIQNGIAQFCKDVIAGRGTKDVRPAFCVTASGMRAGNFSKWNPAAALAAKGVPLNQVVFLQDGYCNSNGGAGFTPNFLFDRGFNDARAAGFTRFGIGETAADTTGEFYTLAVARGYVNNLINYSHQVAGFEVCLWFSSNVGQNAPSAVSDAQGRVGWRMVDSQVEAAWGNASVAG